MNFVDYIIYSVGDVNVCLDHEFAVSMGFWLKTGVGDFEECSCSPVFEVMSIISL